MARRWAASLVLLISGLACCHARRILLERENLQKHALDKGTESQHLTGKESLRGSSDFLERPWDGPRRAGPRLRSSLAELRRNQGSTGNGEWSVNRGALVELFPSSGALLGKRKFWQQTQQTLLQSGTILCGRKELHFQRRRHLRAELIKRYVQNREVHVMGQRRELTKWHGFSRRHLRSSPDAPEGLQRSPPPPGKQEDHLMFAWSVMIGLGIATSLVALVLFCQNCVWSRKKKSMVVPMDGDQVADPQIAAAAAAAAEAGEEHDESEVDAPRNAMPGLQEHEIPQGALYGLFS